MESRASVIGIVMGSDSDWPIMREAASICDEFALGWEARVLSAHRTPEETAEYARSAAQRGLKVLIAGAGGAAHLAGVLAAHTTLPVVGVPVAGRHLSGLDSLLSTVQMPTGVPVATVGIDRSANGALLAIEILALGDPALATRLSDYRARVASRVRTAEDNLQSEGSTTQGS
jgi:5-(carboxyamino)imidazole ribonucleotide mutase